MVTGSDSPAHEHEVATLAYHGYEIQLLEVMHGPRPLRVARVTHRDPTSGCRIVDCETSSVGRARVAIDYILGPGTTSPNGVGTFT